MSIYQKFIQNQTLRRICVLFSLISLLFFLKPFISAILLTFIFIFLLLRLESFIQRRIKIPTIVIVIVLYAIILGLLYFAITKYAPIISKQTMHLYQVITRFYSDLPKSDNTLLQWFYDYSQKLHLSTQLKNGAQLALKYITDLGTFSIAIGTAFILSFFYMIKKKELYQFSNLFLTSTFSWYFQDVHYFAEKFVGTFGVVLEAQFIIAAINTTLTTIALAFLGFHQLPSLALMVFLLGLIPVAGVIISCIPLSILSYYQGGIHDVIVIIIVILCIHFLESYVLNPKLMSKKTDLPIFYTFIILLVSEHLFGLWGLIVGIPIVTFFLDLLGVKRQIKGQKGEKSHGTNDEKKTKTTSG